LFMCAGVCVCVSPVCASASFVRRKIEINTSVQARQGGDRTLCDQLRRSCANVALFTCSCHFSVMWWSWQAYRYGQLDSRWPSTQRCSTSAPIDRMLSREALHPLVPSPSASITSQHHIQSETSGESNAHVAASYWVTPIITPIKTHPRR